MGTKNAFSICFTHCPGAREDSVISDFLYPWDSRGPSHFSFHCCSALGTREDSVLSVYGTLGTREDSVISVSCTLRNREDSVASAFGTLGTREDSVISASGTRGTHGDSYHFSCQNVGTRGDSRSHLSFCTYRNTQQSWFRVSAVPYSASLHFSAVKIENRSS